MTQKRLIVPLCFIVLSGCSVFDGRESTEVPTTAVSAPEIEAPQPAPENQLVKAKEASPAPALSLSVDDIRGMQTRLQELGFDPGPADGMVGAKTKIAFNRLQTACGKLDSLSVTANESSGSQTTAKDPSRADTLKMQNQLRDAGFKTAPVDGVYNARTKSLVGRVYTSCAVAKEFPGGLDKPSRAAAHSETRTASPAEGSKAAAGSVATIQAKTPDEIRALQVRLRDAGFDPGAVDGVMGEKTKSALEQYEASQSNRKIRTSAPASRISSGQY